MTAHGRCRIIAVSLLALSPLASGQDSQTAIVVPGADYFAAGAGVELREPLAGDALLAGGSVESNASVGGDLVAAGGEVAIRATVGDDLYVAGGQVTVDALIAGNARIAGGRVRIVPETRIEGGATIAGGRVAVDGRFGGYLTVAGGDVTLGGDIAGDVRVYADELRVLSGTRIGGRLVHRTARRVQLPADVVVGGGIQYEKPDEPAHVPRTQGNNLAGRIGWIWLAGLLAVGLLLVFWLAKFSRYTTLMLTDRPLVAMATGFLVLACLPALIVALFVTLIGIPLALILLLLYLVMLIGAYVIGALYLGDRALAIATPGVAPGAGRRVGALFLVLIALALVGGIPVIGDLARFAVLLLGLGGILLVAVGSAQDGARPVLPPAGGVK